MKLVRIIAVSVGLATSAAALATDGGYATGIGAPTMTQTNTIYSSSNWSNLSSPNGSVPITAIRYEPRVSSTRQGTFYSRICVVNTTDCSGWTPGTVVSADNFIGYPASTVFYMQTQVAGANAVLSPQVTASGRSNLYVSYVY